MTVVAIAQAPRWTTAKTLDEFAAHLEAESWCVEISGNKPRLLHADSNRIACEEHAAFLFTSWAKSERRAARIDTSHSQNFFRQVEDRLPKVFGTSFRPTDERTFHSQGALMANTYRPPVHDGLATAEGFALLDELAVRVFADPSERKVCLQFCAHIVRHPEVRPQFALLITGAGGTGKSVFVGLIEKAVGRNHCWRENSYEPAFKEFSEVLPNNLLVVFDDAPASSGTYEKLKHAVTRDLQTVAVKHTQRTVLREVYARIIILSNDEAPFTDMSGDRRLYVPKYCVHPIGKDESDGFFRRFNEWAKGSNCAATVHAWLAGVDLTDFDVGAPIITEAHRIMTGDGSDDLKVLVADYLADERLVHIDEVVRHVASRGRRRPSRHEVQKALTAAGYVAKRRTNPLRSGPQIEAWVPKGPIRTRSLNEAEIERFKAVGALD